MAIHKVLFAVVAIPLTTGPQPHRLRSDEAWGRRIVTGSAVAVVVLDGVVRTGVVADLDVRGGYRVIETGKGATVEGLLVRNVHARDIRRGLARFRGPGSGSIENSSVRFSAIPQLAPNLPEGLAFEAGAHDWTVRDVTIRGAQMRMPPNRFWNGDGIATERNTRGFRFIRVTADDNTDAGFDLKSEDTWLDQVSASGNARNYRFWTSVRAGTITVGDTVVRGGKGQAAGIWVLGNPARPPTIAIDRLVVRMTRPASIFAVKDGAATIRVRSCDIRAPRGTRFVTAAIGSPTLELGPGCNPPR